ncbi:type VI secretion system-associated protein TagF [Kalamiella sp. sgz302252]|uniref:type VI secretion system-associated protein TagF n=1 Tax=Pantoea sp. sgz302252 TaxID=3341827 RepID=UPI0036D38D87
MHHASTIGWYGKLPSAGDFLRRRFPEALTSQWGQWFKVGLLNWQRAVERQEIRHPFSHAPVWNFVVPPLLGSQLVQMGCLIPGRDSIGRCYPLCAQRFFTVQSWSAQRLAEAGSWYSVLGGTLLHAMRNSYAAEQLDRALLTLPALADPDPAKSDILDIIGYDDSFCTLSWQQAANCFSPQRYSSFWWTNQADGYPLYTHVHSGNLTGQLFSLLFNPGGGGRPGSNSLYPPMLE